jgi:hypothetical protein
MKLAAIYNVWDGTEHLENSINQIRQHVDEVIVVWQKLSNWGEIDTEVEGVVMDLAHRKVIDHHIFYHPTQINKTIYAINNETEKRQRGLFAAMKLGCSHFLHIDCDEFYDTEEFGESKREIGWMWEMGYTQPVMNLVKIQNYYKLPTLKLDLLDSTLATFISPIIGAKCGAIRHPDVREKVDITRATHPKYEILSGITMHHMSWVRKEDGILKKINNSTARENLKKHKVLEEFNEAEAGTVLSRIYKGATLVETNNRFNVQI